MKSVDVAIQKFPLALAERPGAGPCGIALRQRRPSSLQRTIHRRHGCLQRLRGFRRRAPQHIDQQQDRPLLRGQMLERRHKREANAFAQERPFGGIGVGGNHRVLRNRFQPVAARQIGERIVDAARWAVLHGTKPAVSAAEFGEADVGRDAIKPGPQRGAPVEPLQRLPGADDGFLNRVIGVRHRAEHPVAVPGQGRPVRFQFRDVSHQIRLTSAASSPARPPVVRLGKAFTGLRRPRRAAPPRSPSLHGSPSFRALPDPRRSNDEPPPYTASCRPPGPRRSP